MSTQFYAFGSLCRGEIDESSDIDLLACISCPEKKIDPNKFSIYTHDRLRDLWREGNPFAWHLHIESKLLFSSDGKDFLSLLGSPAPYSNGIQDCSKFYKLFLESKDDISNTTNSTIFNLSCIFLATRNFATCYSLHKNKPIFSRNSPLLITKPLQIEKSAFDIFSRARILSTRGFGKSISKKELKIAKHEAKKISIWMLNLMKEMKNDGIQ